VVRDGAEAVQAQINRLEDPQANDHDASLQVILKKLTTANPIIRHAAIKATIQFGGHTAVPILQGTGRAHLGSRGETRTAGRRRVSRIAHPLGSPGGKRHA